MECQPTEYCLVLFYWVLKEISTKSIFTQPTLFFNFIIYLVRKNTIFVSLMDMNFPLESVEGLAQMI